MIAKIWERLARRLQADDLLTSNQIELVKTGFIAGVDSCLAAQWRRTSLVEIEREIRQIAGEPWPQRKPS